MVSFDESCFLHEETIADNSFTHDDTILNEHAENTLTR